MKNIEFRESKLPYYNKKLNGFDDNEDHYPKWRITDKEEII